MPRKEPLNDLILRALESRQHKAEELKREAQFAYGRAIDAIKLVKRNITNPATQLKNVKNITPTIFGEIISVCSGDAPVEASPPTRRELQQVEQQGDIRWERPPAPGTGGWAILITLYRECTKPLGPPDLTKQRIITLARVYAKVNLEDSIRGFSGWSSIKTMEKKGWVHRDALSKRIGGPNGGAYGGARDRFSLTEEGKLLAATLSVQANDGQHTTRRPVPSPQQQQHSRHGRLAAAAGFDHGGGGDSDGGGYDDEPSGQLLSGQAFAAGDQHGSAPSAGAAAFTGRGHRLGGDVDGNSPAQHRARQQPSAAAGGASSGRAGPTQAMRGGLFCEWEDDWGADPATAYGSDSPSAGAGAAAATAAAARRRRSSPAQARRMSAAAVAGSPAARRQLLPRVKASERPLPLCPADKGCAECGCLRSFVCDGGSGTMLHMANLSKAKQQHVQQVVSWLSAPEGGQHGLTVNLGPGKALSVQRQSGAGAAAQQGPGTRTASAGDGSAAGAGAPDVLGQISRLLSQQQPNRQQQSSPHQPAGRRSSAAGQFAAAAAGAAAGGGWDDDTDEDNGVRYDGWPIHAAQRPAAAFGLGAAGSSEDWMLDEDIQQQAALLEAAAEAHKHSHAPPAQQEQEQRQRLQRQQQPGQGQDGQGSDGMTPAMRAAAAAEARVRTTQQQSRHAADPAAGRRMSQQQQQSQARGSAGATPQQQQAHVPVVIIADSQADEDLPGLADVGQQHAQQQQQQQAVRQPSLRQATCTNPRAAAAAAPCIEILESQDGIPGAGAGGTAATAAGGSVHHRKRQAPDAAPLLLLDSQDDDLLGLQSCLVNQDPGSQSGRPPKRRRTTKQLPDQQQVGNGQGQNGLGAAAAAAAAGSVRGAAAGSGGQPPPCIELLDTQVETFDLPLLHDHDSPAAAAAAAGGGDASADQVPGATQAAGASAGGRSARQAGVTTSRRVGPSVSAGFELKLVVDEKERLQNPDPNRIYSSLRHEHQHKLHTAVLPAAVTVDVDRDSLPLGDYMWLVLPDEQQGQQRTAGGEDVDATEDEDEEAAAAAERSCCLMAGAVVERKTVRDLVGRSAKRDHLRQLQRMHYVADVLPHQLLIIENATFMAGHYVAYGLSSGAAPDNSTVINDEPSLFDFIVKAALSEYGSVQRVLLAPSTADSRGILLAVTQLLIYEQWQQQRQQQQQQRGSSPCAGQRGQQMTYRQFKTLCNQVSRRLPRSALDPVMGPLPSGPPCPPDAAFAVSHGAGEHQGLVLYSHKAYAPLRVVWMEGCWLLKLLNGFLTVATSDLPNTSQPVAAAASAGAGSSQGNPAQQGNLPSGPAHLTSVDAAAAAAEVAAMLSSYLQSFLQAADSNTSTSTQQQQPGSDGSADPPCYILLAENVFGPHGAVNYMNRVQQQACLNPGRQAASRQAAARQQEALALDAAAINEWLWLWLVCFVLQQDWHLHLAQSSSSVRIFLEVAGSRCNWLVEQADPQRPTARQQHHSGQPQPTIRDYQGSRLQQQEDDDEQQEAPSLLWPQGNEQQELQQGHEVGRRRHIQKSAAALAGGAGLPGADAAGAAVKCPRNSSSSSYSDSQGDPTEDEDDHDGGQHMLQQQQPQRPQQRLRKRSGSDFMAWLEQQQQQGCDGEPYLGQAAGLGQSDPSSQMQHQQLQQDVPGSSAAGGNGQDVPSMQARASHLQGLSGVAASSRRPAATVPAQQAARVAGVIPDSEEEDDVIVLD